MDMDKVLIDEFRNSVNENNLVLHMYQNRNGKDQWGIICSAMDWISVAIDGISPSYLLFENSNESSIRMMTFVMCIDVLWEAVQQLHRVIFNTVKIPFENESTIFKHSPTKVSDNNYFKTVRACFAAHPVNLKDYFTNEDKQEKRYASWSVSGIFGTGDFSVILYSNNISKDPITFNVYIAELLQFAEQRYRYLKTLSDELERQKKKYLSDWRKIKIEKQQSLIEQIDTLISEERKRFKSDYYRYQLKKLKILFSTRIINEDNMETVQAYRDDLHTGIDEIFNNLQEMKMQDLEVEQKLNDIVPDSCRYEFSKLVDVVEDDGYEGLVNIDSFRNEVGEIVNLDCVESYVELYVIVLAGFWKLRNNGTSQHLEET